MDIKDLGELLGAVAKAEISELTLETSDYKLQIKRPKEDIVVTSKANLPTVEPTDEVDIQIDAREEIQVQEENVSKQSKSESKLVEITAPIVGTFYDSPSPEAPPYVKEGDRVSAGTVLCIIEAMKLMNEIEAEVSGKVVEVLVRNEEPVEYGQVLFTLDPS